jgi:hypothetical protein
LLRETENEPKSKAAIYLQETPAQRILVIDFVPAFA